MQTRTQEVCFVLFLALAPVRCFGTTVVLVFCVCVLCGGGKQDTQHQKVCCGRHLAKFCMFVVGLLSVLQAFGSGSG
jgi:hypothetical protein